MGTHYAPGKVSGSDEDLVPCYFALILFGHLLIWTLSACFHWPLFLYPASLFLYPALILYSCIWIPLNLSVYSFCSLAFPHFLMSLTGLPAIRFFLPLDFHGVKKTVSGATKSGFSQDGLSLIVIRDTVRVVNNLSLWIRQTWIWIRMSPLFKGDLG